jgi:diacylglycerol O-acyltransferase
VAGPGVPSPFEIAASGLMMFATRPLRLATVLTMTTSTIVKTLGRARSGLTMAAPFAAPPTPVNASVTAHRNIAYTQLELADVKTVKAHFNVKVNDVVIALCAAVLRRFLLDRGELPDRSLVAMVPVSVHETSTRPGRNQVSGMFCRLHTHIADRTERLRAIAGATSVAKDHSSAISPTPVAGLDAIGRPGGVRRCDVTRRQRCVHTQPGLQPDHLQCGRPARTSLFPGCRSQCDVSARPDIPRFGAEHHGDVA